MICLLYVSEMSPAGLKDIQYSFNRFLKIIVFAISHLKFGSLTECHLKGKIKFVKKIYRLRLSLVVFLNQWLWLRNKPNVEHAYFFASLLYLFAVVEKVLWKMILFAKPTNVFAPMFIGAPYRLPSEWKLCRLGTVIGKARKVKHFNVDYVCEITSSLLTHRTPETTSKNASVRESSHS